MNITYVKIYFQTINLVYVCYRRNAFELVFHWIAAVIVISKDKTVPMVCACGWEWKMRRIFESTELKLINRNIFTSPLFSTLLWDLGLLPHNTFIVFEFFLCIFSVSTAFSWLRGEYFHIWEIDFSTHLTTRNSEVIGGEWKSGILNCKLLKSPINCSYAHQQYRGCRQGYDTMCVHSFRCISHDLMWLNGPLDLHAYV